MIKVDKKKIVRIEIDEDSIDDYIGYYNLIKKEMKHPEYLMNPSKKYLLNMLKRNSHIYVYFYKKLIIASGMIMPCDKEAIKKTGLDIDYRDVIEYGPQFVHPEYRGNHLQSYMIDDLRYVAKDLGFKYAIGVVNEKNDYSKNNAEYWGKLVKTIYINGEKNNIYFNELTYLERK